MIPAGAPVAADDGLTPWLADRAEIHGFPGNGDATAYVVVDREAYVPGSTWRASHDAAVAGLSSGDRTLLFDDGRIQVWSPIDAGRVARSG